MLRFLPHLSTSKPSAEPSPAQGLVTKAVLGLELLPWHTVSFCGYVLVEQRVYSTGRLDKVCCNTMLASSVYPSTVGVCLQEVLSNSEVEF